jgi:hypothetical protein
VYTDVADYRGALDKYIFEAKLLKGLFNGFFADSE